MRVLAVASEIYPLIKTGGLADVTGALPEALREVEEPFDDASGGRWHIAPQAIGALFCYA